VVPLNADDVLLAWLALEIDDRVSDGDGLIFGDDVRVETSVAEATLEVVEREFGVRLGVGEDALPDLLDVLLLIRLLQSIPGLLSGEISVDVVSGEKAIDGAVGQEVACG